MRRSQQLFTHNKYHLKTFSALHWSTLPLISSGSQQYCANRQGGFRWYGCAASGMVVLTQQNQQMVQQQKRSHSTTTTAGSTTVGDDVSGNDATALTLGQELKEGGSTTSDLVLSMDKARIKDSFREAVESRTIGNSGLRKYLKAVDPIEWERGTLAVRGCQEGGLRLDPDTSEAFMSLLVQAKELRAALNFYQDMLDNKILPHTNSFNHMMRMAIEKGSASSATALFEDMKRKGRAPNEESYELLLLSYAHASPVKWEEAVELFDELQNKRGFYLNEKIYNSLMTVYLHMTPFDYRVVYNAYYEMRHDHSHKIKVSWDSYDIVMKAFKKGNAPYTLRFWLWLDMHLQTTVPWKSRSWYGFITAICIFSLSTKLLAIPLNWYLNSKAEDRLDGIDARGMRSNFSAIQAR